MSADTRRRIVAVVAVCAVSLLLMRLCTSFIAPETIEDAVIRGAGALGIFGAESVEDFYFLLVALVSILASIGLVMLAQRPFRRRGG